MGVDMMVPMANGREHGHVGTRKFGSQDGGFDRALTGEHELQVGLSHFPLRTLLLFPLSPCMKANFPPLPIPSTFASETDLPSVPPLFSVNVVRH